jgi:hypothetical protein
MVSSLGDDDDAKYLQVRKFYIYLLGINHFSITMTEPVERYKSLLDFLIKKPKNLFSFLIIELSAIGAIFFIHWDFENTPGAEEWGKYAAYALMGAVLVLGYMMFYLLYRRNKYSR